MTVTRRIRSPGRARNKPLRPLRAGMPGESGEPSVTTLVCFTSPFAREAAGALGTRHSPRPLRAKLSSITRAISAAGPRMRNLNQSAAALNSIGACLKAVIPGLASSCAAGRPQLRADALSAGILTDGSLFCANSGGYGRATANPAIGPEIKREHLLKEAADFRSCGHACFRRRRRLRGRWRGQG